MTNYEPPVEISIFDFQNLDFKFLGFKESYFLKILNLNPVSSYYLLEHANRDFLHSALDTAMLSGRNEPEFLREFWSADGDAWGLMIQPEKLNRYCKDFLLDLRARLASRSQDMRGVLDVDTYMLHIRREAFRFWNSLSQDMRYTLMNDLYILPVDKEIFSGYSAQLIYSTAFGGETSDFNHVLACVGIVNHITKITLEVNKYAGRV